MSVSDNHQTIPEPDPRTLLAQVADHFRFLDKMGCPGFDLSDESLALFNGLGFAKGTGRSPGAVGKSWKCCQKCPLGSGKGRMVTGAGDSKARIMFVGGVPEPEDERTGDPFSGKAGALLTKIIKAIGFNRDEVYLGFVVKCRPPNNKKPSLDQIHACLEGLKDQIRVIQPEFLVSLGHTASKVLLNSHAPLSNLRGRFHDFNGVKLIATHHPAELLEDVSKKRLVWEDMKMLMASL